MKLTSLIRLQRQLLKRLDLLLLQLGDLPRKHRLWRRRAINAVGLDTDNHAAANLEVLRRVQAYDLGLVRLRHVGEDDVHHAHQDAVPFRVSRVLDDGDHVRAVRRHVDQVAAGSVGEFDGEDGPFGSDDVGDVRDGGSASCAEVEHFAPWADEDLVQSS